MPRRQLIALALVAALAAACSDAAAPASSPSGTLDSPPPPPPPQPSPPSYDTVVFTVASGEVVIGDTIQTRGSVHRGQSESADSLEWTISDSSVASIRLLDKNWIEILALRSGDVTISARTLGSLQQLSARASLKVLARSSQPSPIVVDSFSVLEARWATPTYMYVPNLRLRDTSATRSARVIGITIDLPGIDRPPMYCATDHVLGAESWPVFPPPWDMNGWAELARHDSQQLPESGVDAVAHVSAVLSDGLGISFTVTGKVIPDVTGNWNESGIVLPPCT